VSSTWPRRNRFFVCVKPAIMAHNLSFENIFIRYFIGIHLVVIAGLLQSFPLVVLAIGILFTCISGWCPVTALINAGMSRKQTTIRAMEPKDTARNDRKAIA
jgi:hypothetical protein